MALRITQSKNADGLVAYFREELSRGDYYSERGTMPGQWFGKGAQKLGLSGDVTQDAFEALAHNYLPGSEEQVTASMRENRRPGYDFTFSVPKSVSVLYEHLMATGDHAGAMAILDTVKASVREAMAEVEANMQVRVRTDGQNTDRLSDNIVCAMFPHFQSRPVGGVADPHLHVHAYVFNMTWDGDINNETLDNGTVVPFDRKGIGGNSIPAGEWKAGQFGQLSKDREYYEAYFEDKVATRMQALGYATARDGKSFEVKGIAEETRDKFSQRTKQIEDESARKKVHDPKKKAALGARTRKNKETGLSPEENRALSHARLESDERRNLDTLKGAHAPEVTSDEAAFAYAEEYWFSRQSAVPEKRFLAEALKAGVGSGLASRIHEVAAKIPGLVRGRDETGNRVVTTEKIRDEERAILRHVHEGKNSVESFAARGVRNGQDTYVIHDERLSGEQRHVVHHVLHDTNDVTGIMGHAGTGKSTALGEVVRAIETTASITPVMLAPTTPARDVLREDGFKADTVALFLADGKDGAALRDAARNGAVIIDEAGLMGTEDMRAVFDTARALNARVILQGDTKQHQSVKRGDALRLLEKKGNLAFASIKTIRRQENEAYRSAVESLVKGDTAEGFDKLEAMGAIREVTSDAKRYQGIAESYAEKRERGHTVVIVSPTHAEIDKVTAAVREKLAATGRLGRKRNAPAFQLRPKNWTPAERGSAHGYEQGQVIEFSRNAPGWKKGDRATVWKAENGQVTVLRSSKNGTDLEQRTLDLSKANAFEVYERRALELAVGDLVRVTQGQKDERGERLERGAIYEVREFAHDGSLLLSKPGEAVTRRVNAERALHLAHGYATTSHASQSLTRHHVIAAIGSDSFPAVSWEALYVMLTRGKYSVEMWTDAKDELRKEAEQSGRRAFALDVVPDAPKQTPQEEAPDMQERRSRVARMVETARKLLRRNREETAWKKHQDVLARMKPDTPAIPTTDVSAASIAKLRKTHAQALKDQRKGPEEEPKRTR